MRGSLILIIIGYIFLYHLSSVATPVCLRIGLLGEFKTQMGGFSQFGNEIRAGAEQGLAWHKNINPNVCISFEVIDIDNSISNIDSCVRKAARDGIYYFIGLGTSDQAFAARKALVDTNSLLLTPTASGAGLLEEPSRTVMLFPTNEIIADEIAKEARRRGLTKILSIYASNNKYSADMNLRFKRAFVKHGGIAEDIAIRAGRVNLSKAIDRLRAYDYKYVFIPLFELDAATVIAELSKNGLHPVFLGTDAWGTYSMVIKNLVKSPEKRAIIPVIYNPYSESPINKLFVSAYQKTFNKLPTDLAAFSFDAVNVAYKLYQVCGAEISTRAIPDCIQKILPIETTTGEVKFARGLSLKRSIQIQDILLGTKQ